MEYLGILTAACEAKLSFEKVSGCLLQFACDGVQ